MLPSSTLGCEKSVFPEQEAARVAREGQHTAARHGVRRKFVEVTVQRQDLWARLAWVSRSLDALAVKAMDVFRQANYGWTRTQADDLARQIAKGETGGGRNLVRNLSGKERRCTDVKAHVSADGVALASQREKAIRLQKTCHGGVQWQL